MYLEAFDVVSVPMGEDDRIDFRGPRSRLFEIAQGLASRGRHITQALIIPDAVVAGISAPHRLPAIWRILVTDARPIGARSAFNAQLS